MKVNDEYYRCPKDGTYMEKIIPNDGTKPFYQCPKCGRKRDMWGKFIK